MKIIVTGPSGNLGLKIIKSLLLKASTEEIVVGVRDVQSEKALNYKALGAEVCATDFENKKRYYRHFKA